MKFADDALLVKLPDAEGFRIGVLAEAFVGYTGEPVFKCKDFHVTYPIHTLPFQTHRLLKLFILSLPDRQPFPDVIC